MIQNTVRHDSGFGDVGFVFGRLCLVGEAVAMHCNSCETEVYIAIGVPFTYSLA